MTTAIAIRKLPLETLYALKARALNNGRSAEAEARAILDSVLNPPKRIKIGSALAALGHKYGGLDFCPPRNTAPLDVAKFT